MASHAAPSTGHDSHAAAYAPGDMPIDEQKSTFTGVMGMFKWGSLIVAAGLTMLTIAFCTPAGILPGIVVAAIMLVLGVMFLRAKPGAGH